MFASMLEYKIRPKKRKYLFGFTCFGLRKKVEGGAVVRKCGKQEEGRVGDKSWVLRASGHVRAVIGES